MVNPNFDPMMSTDNMWHGIDDTRCLTDDLDTLEDDVVALKIGKANSNHTHDDYALASDVDQLEVLVGDTSVATQIALAVVDKASENHTHSYAGSSSAGGAATSANKLNTNAGSATQPVYFENGVPKETTYTLEKSVPASAVFTDTTYTNATTSADGLMSSTDKKKLNDIADGANKTVVDSALSSTSINPVQNKTIYEMFQELSDDIANIDVSSQVSAAVSGKADKTHTHNVSDLKDVTATAAEINILDGVTVSTAQINFLANVTGDIQGQLDNKVDEDHNHNTVYYTQDQVDDLIANAVATVAKAPKSTTFTLYENAWNGSYAPYYQITSIKVTASKSKVDLYLTPSHMQSLADEGITFVASVTNNYVYIYCVGGDCPRDDYTVQVVVTECQ